MEPESADGQMSSNKRISLRKKKYNNDQRRGKEAWPGEKDFNRVQEISKRFNLKKS